MHPSKKSQNIAIFHYAQVEGSSSDSFIISIHTLKKEATIKFNFTNNTIVASKKAKEALRFKRQQNSII